MVELQIKPVELANKDDLLLWDSVLREGFNAGRVAAWWRTPEAAVAQFRSPKPGRTTVPLLATAGDRPVGAAEASVDPGQSAEVEISVLPGHRRQGVGTALANALREALRSQADTVQAEVYSEPGMAFARRMGLAIGNRESRQLLDLPVDVDALQLSSQSSGVSVQSWLGECPAGVVEEWAVLTTQMDADVPMGDLTRSATPTDVAAVRQSERRMTEQGWVLVRSLAQLAGRSVGYTEILVSRHDPEIVVQDDTLVDRDHRGRGIGRDLKIANLQQLHRVPEAASSHWIQTYTALDNTPMLALNHALGFREVDVLTVFEGKLE